MPLWLFPHPLRDRSEHQRRAGGVEEVAEPPLPRRPALLDLQTPLLFLFLPSAFIGVHLRLKRRCCPPRHSASSAVSLRRRFRPEDHLAVVGHPEPFPGDLARHAPFGALLGNQPPVEREHGLPGQFLEPFA
jgi:hypothetical protein